LGETWWQHGIIYQIYPRSFLDTNRDGVGDLEGIIHGLDYLCWLGVDAVWLSPIYRSPMADFGYDIVDHCAIDPVFGHLTDFDRLVAEAHRRGIKLPVVNSILGSLGGLQPTSMSSVEPHCDVVSLRR
jgi:alpha-glucosidase